jgi:hypothetical protein
MVPVLASTALSFGCASRSEDFKWTAIAGADGGSAARQDLVRGALRANGIRCYMQGSLGYDVMVPKDQAEKARKVLAEEPQLQNKDWFNVLPKKD